MSVGSDLRPLVSVIVPTFNSATTLDLCLGSVEKQTYERIETLVVDDGSSDRTLQIAKAHPCRIVQNPKRGRAEAKNEGLRRAAGKYVLFLDSDMELTSQVVSDCVSLASKPGVGAVVIPERSVGRGYWVRVRDLERSLYEGSVVESARFFVTSIAREAGGFEEGLIFYEEATLPYRVSQLGYSILYRTSAKVLHQEEGFKLSVWLRKKFAYGKTKRAYVSTYRNLWAKQKPAARAISLLKNGRRLADAPSLAAGVVLLKTLEAVAVALGSATAEL